MTDEDLRRLLKVQGSQPDSSQNQEACPDPEELWALVSGEVEPARAGQILDHALHCESCREALSIARTAAAEAEAEAAAEASSGSRWIAIAGSIAAILIAAVLFTLPRDERVQHPERIRAGAEGTELWEDLNHGKPMPRANLTLRWKPMDGATDYLVEVYSPDLDLLLRSERLTQPLFPIETDSLAALTGFETLLWRVEARLVTGGLIRSPVFRTELVADDTP